MVIINEPGLYRLIMRSDKPEAKRFQQWVFREVLPQIRKTGAYVPTPPLSYPAQLDELRAYMLFVEDVGLLDDRDKLMMKDMARTLLTQKYPSAESGTSKALAGPASFFLSDRIRALGYALSRKQEASLMAKGLARDVAKEYRRRHEGHDPLQSQRFVDGAVRPVFWYQVDEATWIDPIIQAACARANLTINGQVDL